MSGDLIEGQDYFVYLVPFPHPVNHGAVTPNDDGTFTVYIDSNQSPEQQLESLDHELDHIRNDDFYNDRSISEVEGFDDPDDTNK